MADTLLRIPNGYQRTIACGDVHGCFAEFETLLRLVKFNPNDVMVCVGDLVDQGPQSWEVARFFREVPNAYTVLGNHERRVARTVRGTSLPAWSQKHTLALLDHSEWIRWAEYFESLPAVIETEHAIVTHARLDPRVPLDAQDPYFTCAVGGPSVVIEKDAAGVPLWFHDLAVEKPICMGHVGYNRVELLPGRLYALDTHVVRKGELSAVVLPEVRIVSVPGARDYYQDARHRWSQEKEQYDQLLGQWRLLRSLPDGDPDGWPLDKVAALLKLEGAMRGGLLAGEIQRVKSAIERLGLLELADRTRDRLLERFGEVPPPGPERGDYYQNMKFVLPLGGLAAALLSSSLENLDYFVPLVVDGTLVRLKAMIERLMET